MSRTLSDGGRLFLNLFSNDRVGRAAQRLGVRAAFWNLRCGERYDVTHPANFRLLLRDIEDGGILGCMISVPSTGWNVARCCDRPLRSSAQPWGIQKSRVSMSFTDLACPDTGNRIMRTAMSECQRTVGDRESRKISLLDDITDAGVVKDAQCVQNDFRFLCFRCQMAKTYNSSSRSRGLGGRGSRHHAPSRTGTMQFLPVTNTCNSWGVNNIPPIQQIL